jgi:hypothetical protein
MSFSASSIITKGKPEPQVDPNELNIQEIEFLLFAIKNANFKGEQLELLYNTVIKLQNQYTSKSK